MVMGSESRFVGVWRVLDDCDMQSGLSPCCQSIRMRFLRLHAKALSYIVPEVSTQNTTCKLNKLIHPET